MISVSIVHQLGSGKKVFLRRLWSEVSLAWLGGLLCGGWATVSLAQMLAGALCVLGPARCRLKVPRLVGVTQHFSGHLAASGSPAFLFASPWRRKNREMNPGLFC